MRRFRHLLVVTSVTALLFLAAGDGLGAPRAESLAQLPLSFEQNGGGFLAHGDGYSVGLSADRPSIRTFSGTGDAGLVSLEFAGARSVSATPEAPLPGKVNYIFGNDPAKWRTGLATWERVRYSGVYPGIDVVYYGRQKQLEFDLVLKAGADPRRIRMKVSGGSGLSIDDQGALLVGGAKIELPRIYQTIGDRAAEVRGRFVIRGKNEVGVELGSYDRSKTLVIDPTILYSAMLSGGGSSVVSKAIAVDSSGNTIIAGSINGSDFPTVNAAQSVPGNGNDVFVSKINAAGDTLLYSTYLGGTGSDVAYGIATDSAGSAWITGSTTSYSSFPVLDAAQSTAGGSTSAFVAKFNSAGVLQFSTYLGGSNFFTVVGYSVAVDGSGNGYVTGYGGNPFTTTSGALATGSAFVNKYAPDGSIVYSALIGGTGADTGRGIAVDSNGNAYVTGVSSSPLFNAAPAGGAHTTNNAGMYNADGFVAKLNPTATNLLSFTFLGSTSPSSANAIAVDGTGNAWIVGTTRTAGLGTSGTGQSTIAGSNDGFVAQLNPTGSAFNWFTYLGGRRFESVLGIALDGKGNAWVTGETTSNDFPAVQAVQPAIAGNSISLLRSADSGTSWSVWDSNLPGVAADISVNPSGASAVALTDSGIYRSTDGGNSWSIQSSYGSFNAIGPALLRSSTNANTIYAFAGGQFLVSTDDGVTWKIVESVPSQAGVADPTNANLFYAYPATNSSVLLILNSNGPYSQVSNFVLPLAPIQSMVATSDGTLYVAFNGWGIYRSTDHAQTWSAFNTGLSTLQVSGANSLTVSGTTVYFAGDQLYKLTSGASAWVGTGSVVSAPILASPQNASVVYALSADNSMIVSSDGGSTWSEGQTIPADLAYATPRIIADASSSSGVFVQASVNTSGFVTKINGSGDFVWSTFLGGPVGSIANSVAPDTAGNATVTGNGSLGFPTTTTALPSGTEYLSQTHAFVARIAEATAACALQVNASDQIVPSTGGSTAFSVVAPSGCSWTAAADHSWVAVAEGGSGTGSGNVVIRVPANTGANRTAILTIGTTTVNITQAGAGCVNTTDQSTYLVPSGGGTVSIVMTTGATCPWSVRSPSPTVTVTSSATGTGSATITVQVAANPSGYTRYYFVDIGTATPEISQGVSTAPVIVNVNPGSGTVGVPYTGAFTVGSGSPPYGPYAITSGALPPGLSLNTVTGTITGTPSSAGNSYAFSATVEDSNHNVSPAASLYFAVSPGAAITAINNAADLSAAPLAPGSIAQLTGTLLATSSATAGAGAAPFTLGGATVSVNGRAAAILSASATKIVFQVPYETAAGTATVTVVANGSTSNAVQFGVVAAAPGVFSVLNNSASTPASSGGTATIYFTGAGAQNPAMADGAVGPTTSIPAPVFPVSVTIGGSGATVSSQGLVPGLVGYSDTTVQVPAGLAAGVYPVIVTANGRSSLPGNIYVQGAAPSVTGVTPNSAPLGSAAVTVNITGSNFGGGAVVRWTPVSGTATNITPGTVTTTQISATIPPSLLVSSGTAQIAVVDALGVASGPVTFHIVPVITSVSPSRVTAGSGDTTVTIVGSGLSVGSVLSFTPPGGTAQSITVGSAQAAQMTATVPAADLSAVGIAEVAVGDGSGGFSNSLPMTLNGAPGSTTLTLTTSAGTSILGHAVSFTAYILPAVATGKVTFYSGTTVLGTRSVSNGGAVFTTAMLPAGSQIIRARYSGDNTYAPAASAAMTQKITTVASNGLAAPVIYGSNPYSACIATGDFDGDGKQDLAVCDSSLKNNIDLLKGNGDGTFQPPVLVALSAPPSQLTVTDFNGDGKQDLAATTHQGVYILPGNGDGTFGTPLLQKITTASGVNTVFAIVADFNQDGIPDLVASNSDGSIVSFLGVGDGTFRSFSTPGTAFSYGNTMTLAAGDFNGDGIPDFVSPDITTMGLRVFLGNGDGSFQNPIVQTGSSELFSYQIATADLNGDGKTDLILSTSGLSIALGNGDGTFGARVSLPAIGPPMFATATDFNGDGKMDILTGGNVYGYVILLGDGAGNFPTSATYPWVSYPHNIFLTGSFDGSGHVDIADTGLISVWLDSSVATPVAKTVSPASAEVGDAATTVTVTGINIGLGTNVLWMAPDGAQTTIAPATQTTPGQLTFAVAATLLTKPGTAKVALVNDLNETSNALSFGITPFTISSIATGPVNAGASYAMITVNGPTAGHAIGLSFTPPGGSPKTIAVSAGGATQVSATIPGEYLTVAGTAQVALIKSEGVVSNSLSLTIRQPLVAPGVVLTSSGSAVLLGKPVTFTASVSPAPAAGKVFFYDGTALVGGGPVVNGVASVTSILLAPGSHGIVARYTGDGLTPYGSSNRLMQTITSMPALGFGAPSGFSSVGNAVAAGDFNGDGYADLAFANQSSAIITILLGKGDGTFHQPVSYNGASSSSASQSVAAADLNGDGKTDIVVVDYGSSNVSVLMGNGDGTFQPVVPYSSTSASAPTSAIVSDFNRDGTPDVLTVSNSGYTFWPGVGDGTLGKPIDVEVSGIQFWSPVSGDFNNDGKTDFLVATYNYGNYMVRAMEMFGNGDGTFQQSTPLFASASLGTSLLAADFNGDGVSDLVVGGQIALASGNGTFGALLPISSANAYSGQGLAADLNGDGKTDILETSTFSAATIYYGNGDGTFGSLLQLPGSIYSNIVLADFNGDGLPDLAATSGVMLGLSGPLPTISSVSPSSVPASSGTVQIVVSGSNFTPGAKVRIVTGGTSLIIPTQVTATQITANVQITAAATGQISVILGNGLQSNSLPFYITPFQITGTTPGSVMAGSNTTFVTVAGTGLSTAVNMIFTPVSGSALTIPLSQIQATQATATIPAILLRNAGTAQIALANATGVLSNSIGFTITASLPATTVSVVTSASSSVFGRPVTITATVSPPSATGRVTFYSGARVIGTRAVSGGKATLVTSLLPTGTQPIRAHYSGDASNGSGNAAAISQTIKSNVSAGLGKPGLYGSNAGVEDLAIGDFNNDGIADIVAVNGYSSGVTVLLGDGAGAFHQSAIYTISNLVRSVKVADFNGDGNADIAVATGQIMVFTGNGDGTFQTPIVLGGSSVLPPTCCSFTSIAVADLDGDGVPDIAAGQSDGTVSILIGNGDGTLSLVSSFGTVSSYFGPLPVIAEDFNGDGVPDIVYAGGGFVRTFLGNGDGTFGNSIAGPAAGSWLISGDFNGDGKPDLATSIYTFPFQAAATVALGNGDGTFKVQPASVSGLVSSSNAIAADFDGDGKADVVFNTGSYSLATDFGNGDGAFGRQTVIPLSYANQAAGLAVADFNGDGVADLVTGPGTTGVAVLLGEPGATPVITSVTPSYALVGSSAVTVTLSGQNLGQTVSMNVSGSAVAASQVQANQVIATIPASSLTYRSTPSIYLTDSAGVASNALIFPVVDFAITSVTPNSAPAGSQAVQITITGSNMSLSQYERLAFQLPNGTTQQLALTNETATQATAFIPAAWLTTAGTGYVSLAYDKFSNPLAFTILPAAATPSVTVSSSLNPAKQSQAITFTAQVSPANATGTVIFYDGITAIGRGTLVSGQASVTTNLLAGGKRPITAHYLGDSQNGPDVSAAFAQVVTAVPSNGLSAALNYVTGSVPTTLAMADLNHDGTPDLVTGNSPGGICVLIGNSDGSFRPAVTYPLYYVPISALAIDDFDGDGIPDVMAVVQQSYGMQFLKGNGDGTFQTAVFIGAGSTTGNPTGGSTGDFNGDGVPDMISPYTANVSAWLGLGNGTFAPAIPTNNYGVVMATGDFNGDGKLDFISGGSASSNVIAVMKGNGDGSFQTPIHYTADGSGVVQSMTTGDFNNDGNLDFAFADGAGVWMALGKGDATFTLSPVQGAGNSPQAVTACDFDGDGNLDLCIADGSIANGGAIVLRGNGDGTFKAPLAFGTGIQAIGIVAGDFNGDGETDIALINQGVYSVSVLLGAPGTQPQTIGFGTLNNVVAGTAPITLTASASSGLPVEFTSNTSAVCSVSGGIVTVQIAGGCSITASQAGNAMYAPVSVTQTFTVLYGDIAPTDHYYAAVNALAQHGITAGCGSNNFCPQALVTRDQMAIFIIRAIYGGDNFTYSLTPYFADVQPSAFGFKWIQKMKELGITSGCTATAYCPSATVTRDQMAIFIIRARLGVALAGANPTFTYPSTPYFTDVPPGAFGYAWIERMKRDNITSGCTASDYCPSVAIIRGDMAIFIMRAAFNEFLPAGTPVISQISPSTLAAGTTGAYTITGTNTNWVQGTTVLSPIPGVTIGAITVNSPTSMTVQLTAASNAVTQPYSVLAITGSEEDVLPNGLVIQ